MRPSKLNRASRLFAGATVFSLLLAACAEDGGNGDSPGGDNPLSGADITIGVFEGWDEGIAASFIWGAVLEAEGANVSYEWGDPLLVYAGVAQGDFDLSFDAWLPTTHEDYWAQYGDDLEDLGVWYDEAPLTIAVNEDAPITSLAELADAADEFRNQIVGIEPGAGLTRITREQVIPTYGLQDMDFIEGSTNAMLAELQAAIDAGENIVVTLWQPHWAYAAYPIRNLEDPEGALGDPEQIHSFARAGFSEDYPEVAEWIGNFYLSEEQLTELERIMVVQNDASTEEEYAASIQEWLDANPDWIDQLKAGELRP